MSQQDSTQATAEQQTEVQIFRLLAGAIHNHLPAESIDETKVREIVEAEVKAAQLPRPIEVRLPDGQRNQIDTAHHQLEEVLSLIGEGHQNVLMVGPAGSGKTTLAKNLAQALGLEFGFISLSQGVTESHLLGRILPQGDGSWQYQPSRFIEVFENGGVFLLDEIDAADPNLMVSINAALANGILANPNGTIHKRHEKTIIIAAANTWGRGADASCVGRNALDASTLVTPDWTRPLKNATTIRPPAYIRPQFGQWQNPINKLRPQIAQHQVRARESSPEFSTIRPTSVTSP